MHFLVDAQLPPALARWLEDMGHTAEHVQDSGLIRANDAEIWDRAIATNSIIVTKDEDFSVRAVTSPPGPPVIWIRTGNIANRTLLTGLGFRWPEIEQALRRGEKLIEVV